MAKLFKLINKKTKQEEFMGTASKAANYIKLHSDLTTSTYQITSEIYRCCDLINRSCGGYYVLSTEFNHIDNSIFLRPLYNAKYNTR